MDKQGQNDTEQPDKQGQKSKGETSNADIRAKGGNEDREQNGDIWTIGK